MTLLPPTQIGVFAADTTVVNQIGMATSGGGMIIGVDQDDSPVVVPLFAAEPREIVSVGSVGFAKLIAFRALALGSKVWVETNRPAFWETFIRMSAGSSGAINLVRQFPDVGGSTADNPSLVLVDSDASVSEEDQLGSPWVTVLTSYGQLTQWNAPDLAQADLLLMQPMSLTESKIAGSALNMGDAANVLAQLPSDVIIAATRNGMQAARVRLTSVEQWLIGSIVRHDERGS